jgi:RNA polymerase subunit RPABC4/transcription elongation factor Spt4
VGFDFQAGMVMNPAKTIWNWISKRSPQKSAMPYADQSSQYADRPAVAQSSEPIEHYFETESIQGSQVRTGLEEFAFKGPGGELIRGRSSSLIIIGCSHLVSRIQQPSDRKDCTKGIAGRCYYCSIEAGELLSKGLISPFDAERLSLVCTDCARITSSGRLCCPRHYTMAVNPDGTTVYIDPEEALKQKRQQTATTIITGLAGLFAQETPKQDKD